MLTVSLAPSSSSIFSILTFEEKSSEHAAIGHLMSDFVRFRIIIHSESFEYSSGIRRFAANFTNVKPN